MTIDAYEVDCANIASLNDPDTLKFLGFTSSELACPWEDLATQKQDPPTWKLVDRLHTLGITGIQCRSFAPGCTEQNHNLILWEWADTRPNSICVINDFGRIPKPKGSWNDELSK